jgi:hypothetical protein
MKRAVKFETPEVQRMHECLQEIQAQQQASGSTARWLAEARRHFWRSTFPWAVIPIAVPTALFIGAIAYSGGDPMRIVSVAGAGTLMTLVVSLILYPSA